MVLKLLLVTDDIPFRQVVRGLAAGLGADLRVAEDAGAARQVIHDEHFHGIVVDTSLPGLSREELVWFVRKSKLNGPTPLYLVAGARVPPGPQGSPSEGSWGVARTPGLPELRALLSELKRKTAVERRKYRRLPFRSLVNGVQGTRHFRATSLDLSPFGMLLEVSLHFERGDEFDLYFQLEEESPALRVQARVVRTAGTNRFGVAFESLNPDYRRRLTLFLERHLSAAR